MVMGNEDSICFEGIDMEDPAKRFLLNRMAFMLSKKITTKNDIEKLEIKKDQNRITMRLLYNSKLTESAAEDKNLFFAFGKAQDALLKKLKS